MSNYRVGLYTLAMAIPLLAASKTEPNFSRDVAPIFYKSCAECHRNGEAAPMQLLSYQEVRPWAKAIRERVVTRAMPPWLADPKHGQFVNDRSLSQKEIDTIAAWVDAGAPEGNPRELPPLPKFTEGWVIGEPDVVIKLEQPVPVAATGVIPYQYFVVPTHFTEDKWVQSAEIRPGNRAVVHHVIVSILEPGKELSGFGAGAFGRLPGLVGFAPGEQPKILPTGVAKMVKAGSKLVFQMHYTPNGKEATDQTHVGIRFARDPVRKYSRGGMIPNIGIRIPPGDPNYEAKASWTASDDVRLISFMPHMHIRGKDFKYTAVYPDGRSEVLLNVPRYDFNWQLIYRPKDGILLPKGTRIDVVAHYDNSPNNKFNPDPTKEVRWGPQTWEEMMIGWFEYTREDEDLTKTEPRPSGSGL